MSRIAEDRYHEVDEDIITEIEDLITKHVATTVKVDYTFVGDRKAKSLIKVSKIVDKFAYILNSPIIIEINELLWSQLSNEGNDGDEALLILFKEAFEGIVIDESTGKAKTVNATFSTTKGVLKKYEFEAVDRAHKLQDDAIESIKDSGDEIPIESEIDISEELS
jgi:hypothetical protein